VGDAVPPDEEEDLLIRALAPEHCAALVGACPLFFGEHPVAALEVLLRPDLLDRLAASDEASNAAEVLAAGPSDNSYPDTVGTMLALRQTLDRRQAVLALPDIGPEGLPAVAREISARMTEPERSLVLLSLVVRMLARATDPASKVARLVACLGRGKPHAALAHVDRLLGDLLARPDTARAIVAPALPSGAVISALLDGAEGQGEGLAERAPVLDAIVGADSYARLGRARKGMRAAAIMLLGQPGRLTPGLGEPSDLIALAEELREMRTLGTRMRRLAEPEEERALKAAQRRRAVWLLQEPVLTSALSGLDAYQGLRALFDLQAAVLDFDLRPVDDRLRRLLNDRHLSAELRRAVPSVIGQIRMFGELQRMALKSGFPAAERERAAKMFDGFQLSALKRSDVLAAMSTEKDVDLDLVLQLADLCAAGDIAEGESQKIVHRHLRKTVRRPLFFRAVLEGSGEDQDRLARLASVLRRLRAAGIECRSPQDLRILVCDDEPGARNFVRMVLKDLAVGEVLVAQDGREALERFEAEKGGIDMIIADWRMPRLTGVDLLRRIRKSHPDLPFLMITALATVPAVREAMHHEVDGYLAKPFPPEQLEEKILTLINR